MSEVAEKQNGGFLKALLIVILVSVIASIVFGLIIQWLFKNHPETLPPPMVEAMAKKDE